MRLSDFDFDVPEHLVAQVPVEPRDRARLLIRRSDGRLDHTHVSAVVTELPAGALLIVNDSRVIPSRLFGRTATGGSVEVFLVESLGERRWRALARPLRKLKPGSRIDFAGELTAEVEAREEMTAIFRLGLDDGALLPWLERHAYIPLPPYIRRDAPEVAERSPDRVRYQTVYAHENGSVAAPTAGLHFTPELLSALEAKGVELQRVRLHVGAGTFLPVKAEDIEQHVMHTERTLVPRATLERLFAARDAGQPVIAVGTTSLRSLEALYQEAGGERDAMRALCDKWRTTSLFLRPSDAGDRYVSRLLDGLWTNFHQPRSTLYMLVSALLGVEEARRVYRTAIERQYRLFSYGDASLLWLNAASRPGI